MEDGTSQLVKVNELLQLQSLGINVSDVIWSRVRVSSDKWISVTRKKERPTKEGINSETVVIDPVSGHVKSFEMEFLKSAQVSPVKNVIALASKEKIFVVDLESHECIGWNRFPCEVDFWTWITKNIIAIIGDAAVYHWNIDTDQLTFMFQRHVQMSGNQITGYFTDANLSWFVIRSLFGEADGAIGGMIQVFSSEYDHSTCIEGYAACIVDHILSGRQVSSRLLVVVRRVSSKLMKLTLTELGPQKKPIKHALLSRNETFSWTNEEDIPSLLVCSSSLRFIYLLSKHGSLFVFELETCTPIILHERICPDIVFSAVVDSITQGVIAISRNGQILRIEVNAKNDRQQQQHAMTTSASPLNHHINGVKGGEASSKRTTLAHQDGDKEEEPEPDYCVADQMTRL